MKFFRIKLSTFSLSNASFGDTTSNGVCKFLHFEFPEMQTLVISLVSAKLKVREHTNQEYSSRSTNNVKSSKKFNCIFNRMFTVLTLTNQIVQSRDIQNIRNRYYTELHLLPE